MMRHEKYEGCVAKATSRASGCSSGSSSTLHFVQTILNTFVAFICCFTFQTFDLSSFPPSFPPLPLSLSCYRNKASLAPASCLVCSLTWACIRSATCRVPLKAARMSSSKRAPSRRDSHCTSRTWSWVGKAARGM